MSSEADGRSVRTEGDVPDGVAPSGGVAPPDGAAPPDGDGVAPADGEAVEDRAWRLRAAFAVSSTGDWIYRLAVPLLVLQTTGSAVSTAFAYTLEFIPYILVGLVAGVLTDRADRRRVMVRCDLLSALIAVEIAVVASFARPSLLLLYLSVFALACVRPFYFPAFQGLLVDKYRGPRLVRLNSWTQAVDSLLTLLGPVAGAAVVVAVGATAASLANAVTFIASALLVASISYRRPATTTPAARGLRGIGADFVAGIRIVLSSRFVVIGAAVITIGNLAIFVIEGNLFYLAVNVEELPRIAVGIVFAGQGAGSVIGAMLAPRLIERVGTRAALWVGVAISAFAMCLPVLWPHWPMVLVAWTIQGVSTSFVVVAYFTARQQLIPADAIGRAASVTRAVAYTALPVGALLGGYLLERSGSVRTIFGWAAAIEAVLLVVPVVGWAAKSRSRSPAAAEPG
ncbi:MAG TPA: MFS transporter [Mycobacteriales bacterium]|nr:MFS transporter [Mycobacteriales bacterium]